MMTLTGYTLTMLNLLLCVIVFVFGLMGYRKSKIKLLYYISLAFGLFGIYHVLSISPKASEAVLVSITVLAYLIVILPLYTAGRGTLS